MQRAINGQKHNILWSRFDMTCLKTAHMGAKGEIKNDSWVSGRTNRGGVSIIN